MTAGFAVAGVALAFVAIGVGFEELLAALGRSEPEWIVLGFLSTFCCLVAWSKVWQVVLETVDVDVAFDRLVVTYFASTFANYVTPLGQAGGEPFIAYVLSRGTEADYERSLASVVTADLLNLFPFFTFAGVGFVAVVFHTSLPRRVQPMAVGLLGLGVGIPVGVAVLWRFRSTVAQGGLRAIAPIVRRVPRITLENLRKRVKRTISAFEVIADEPRQLGRALVFSFVGWVFFALPLFFAVEAIGLSISVVQVLFIVPASTLAGIVPTPGGLGGVEIALAALLLGIVGLTAPEAYAAALLYRLVSYWFSILIGGLAAAIVVSVLMD